MRPGRSSGGVLAVVVALVIGASVPAAASPSTGAFSPVDTYESCYAGRDGSCATAVAADVDGTFSGMAATSRPDSRLFGRTVAAYALSLARYEITFDLRGPTSEAHLDVRIELDSASASWTQDGTEVFGGRESDMSGAKVLFQLLGAKAPHCPDHPHPCQISMQAPDIVVVEATEVDAAEVIKDETINVKATLRGRDGELLPKGSYSVLLRAYALGNLYGEGDWGDVAADVRGRIESVSVWTGPGRGPAQP